SPLRCDSTLAFSLRWPCLFSLVKCGAPGRTRTGDIVLGRHAPYQLGDRRGVMGSWLASNRGVSTPAVLLDEVHRWVVGYTDCHVGILAVPFACIEGLFHQ